MKSRLIAVRARWPVSATTLGIQVACLVMVLGVCPAWLTVMAADGKQQVSPAVCLNGKEASSSPQRSPDGSQANLARQEAVSAAELMQKVRLVTLGWLLGEVAHATEGAASLRSAGRS